VSQKRGKDQERLFFINNGGVNYASVAIGEHKEISISGLRVSVRGNFTDFRFWRRPSPGSTGGGAYMGE